jgi:hypothetical protein
MAEEVLEKELKPVAEEVERAEGRLEALAPAETDGEEVEEADAVALEVEEEAVIVIKRMRLFCVSATITLPLESTATA